MTQNKFKPVNLRDIFLKYAYHWPLFVLGLAISVIVTRVYLSHVIATFQIQATILVKDEKKTKESKSALEEIDQSDNPKIAENEVEILSSRKLVSQVVDELHLWVDYTTKKALLTESLYTKTPANFAFITHEDEFNPVVFNIKILDTNTFVIKNKDESEVKYRFNQVINTNDFGRWKLQPTPNINKYLGKSITITVTDSNTVAERYQQSLQVSLLNKLAPTIGLSINDKQTQRGKDFLNYLISDYNQAATSEKNKLTKSTIDFIDKRLDSLRGDLSHAESAVEDFKSSKGLTDVTSESKIYLENRQTNDTRLNEINLQLNTIEGLERYTNSPQNSNPPTTLGISDPALVSLVERLSQLQLQKAKLLAITPEGNPAFDPINRQIKITNSEISNNIKTIKASLLSTKTQLESFKTKYESSIKNVPGQERQLLGVNRQQSVKENLYVYLLQKREELSLSYAGTLSDARIVDSAYIGPMIWPQKGVLNIAATLIGLLIPFMMIYLRDSVKDKVLTKGDIEGALNVNILGEIPTGVSNDALIDHTNNNAVSENFRAIRTKLYYANATHEKGRVIMVTSSVDGEGKSFISGNLSTSLAFSGRKTVLLELDMRKPQITKVFELSKEMPGLSDYLSTDNLAFSDLIQKSTAYPNLDIMGSGRPVNNPAELLDSNRLDVLIKALKEHYDDIIIDSPPLHLVTDALIISRLTDINIYIIRQGVTNKSELVFINETIEANELKDIKIIFNGVENGKYGYGRQYANSYYSNASQNLSFKKSVKKFFSRF